MKSVHSNLKLNMVVDHKNGRYNDNRLRDINKQTINDFQPLTNNENLDKRECCKKCTEANKRFNATILGYVVSYIQGDENYIDSPDGCVGCYWHDCLKFKQSLILSTE